MKLSYKTLVISLLLTSSSVAIAATDSKSINIEIEKGEYVQLVGSAVDGNTKVITLQDVINGTSKSLGTLGVDTNIVTNCNISFETTNTFALKHSSSEDILKKFTLTYLTNTIDENNLSINGVSCLQSRSNLTFNPTGAKLVERVRSGTYNDTITVTVTSL